MQVDIRLWRKRIPFEIREAYIQRWILVLTASFEFCRLDLVVIVVGTKQRDSERFICRCTKGPMEQCTLQKERARTAVHLTRHEIRKLEILGSEGIVTRNGEGDYSSPNTWKQWEKKRILSLFSASSSLCFYCLGRSWPLVSNNRAPTSSSVCISTPCWLLIVDISYRARNGVLLLATSFVVSFPSRGRPVGPTTRPLSPWCLLY